MLEEINLLWVLDILVKVIIKIGKNERGLKNEIRIILVM